MTAMTLLAINLISGADASVRGIKQTLTLIAAATVLKRTVNGHLVDISQSQFRKYKSTISGADQLPPTFDGVYPGLQVTVSCVAELSYVTSGGSPSRTVVSGSSRTEGSFTFYRPQLTMLVVNFNQSTDEWGAQTSWSLELEEV